MRILDESGEEIMNPDLKKGKLIDDKVFVKHHDRIPGKREKGHYEPTYFIFSDGSIYQVSSKDDPHVSGLEYVNIEGEIPKEVVETGKKYVVDVPKVEAIEAWDEYEQIKRYVRFTEEELKKMEEKEAFLSEGYSLLQDLQNKADKQTETLNLLATLLQKMNG